MRSIKLRKMSLLRLLSKRLSSSSFKQQIITFKVRRR